MIQDEVSPRHGSHLTLLEHIASYVQSSPFKTADSLIQGKGAYDRHSSSANSEEPPMFSSM
jgi:hypothetical protein